MAPIIPPTAKREAAFVGTSLTATVGPELQNMPSVQLARDLIRIESVTPNDNGCQNIIASRLEKLGFATETMKFNDVTNLWAVRGEKRPLVVFAGHTDVVPSGPAEQWTFPPYEGVVNNDILYGRGAADMKGGLASFVVAVERFVNKHADSPDLGGSIGFLLTSDEEGVARWGTREVMSKLTERGKVIDMCIVGEASSKSRLGDIVKVGRRGSLSGELTVKGIQGHVAYPHLARNPIHESLAALNELVGMKFDDGNDHFQPTSFQISNIAGGTGATNVIPGHKSVRFNFRYSPETNDVELKARVRSIFEGHDLDYEIDWSDPAYPYETSRGKLVNAAIAAVKSVIGIDAEACTSGGTSDGRFIAASGSQVVELGPVYKTIHKVNECVAATDLETLTDVYEDLLGRLLLS